MNWVTRGDASFSGGYRIVRTIHGFELWYYGSKRSGCIGRQIGTLEKAKQLAEDDKAKALASA